MTITGRQIREARALPKWDRSTLARRTGLPTIVVERAEASDGELLITVAEQAAIKRALAAAGIELTADPPGARLRPASAASHAEA